MNTTRDFLGWRQDDNEEVSEDVPTPQGAPPHGDIRAWIKEASSIEKEIKRLNAVRKPLLEKKKNLESHIAYFIDQSGHVGVKTEGTSALRFDKVVRRRGKKEGLHGAITAHFCADFGAKNTVFEDDFGGRLMDWTGSGDASQQHHLW